MGVYMSGAVLLSHFTARLICLFLSLSLPSFQSQLYFCAFSWYRHSKIRVISQCVIIHQFPKSEINNERVHKYVSRWSSGESSRYGPTAFGCVAECKLIDDDQPIAGQLVNKLASQSHFNKVQLGSSPRVVCGVRRGGRLLKGRQKGKRIKQAAMNDGQ